jgi:hypothetical protein
MGIQLQKACFKLYFAPKPHTLLIWQEGMATEVHFRDEPLL